MSMTSSFLTKLTFSRIELMHWVSRINTVSSSPRLTNFDLDGFRKRPMSASIHEHIFRYYFASCTVRPRSTMECSQPTAWTTNRSFLVASRVRPFQEDRPIPARPYPELRTWMVVRSGVISVFPTHSGNAPASPDIRPTTWLCHACLPSTNSIHAPIQPTIAMTTTHIHQLLLTQPPSTRNSSASEDHPQAPVVVVVELPQAPEDDPQKR